MQKEVPESCNECKSAKSIDSIQDPFTKWCKKTHNWLCPESGRPNWCPKYWNYLNKNNIDNKL